VTDVPFAGASAALTRGIAFLELGERLRQRGQLAAAAAVTVAGLVHYPAVADAHDLLGRIRADQGNDAEAIAAWHAALECEPEHVGARKGLAFVAFRSREFSVAERHLEAALLRAPHDATLLAAIDRVRSVLREPTDDAIRLADPASGVLLFDMQGLRLAGNVGESTEALVADAVAAEGSGLAREAERAARLLGLGAVRHLVIETANARIVVMPVSPETALLLHRSAATPLGRLLALSGRAAHTAREWLERMA
jgi:predicted regulator of Ras-like GTPase activity (Roadblock/LC7/MglB family)